MQALQSWAPSIWTNRPDKHACSAPRPTIDMSGLKRKRNDGYIDSPRLADLAPVKRMRIEGADSRKTRAAQEEESFSHSEAQALPGAQNQATAGHEYVDTSVATGGEARAANISTSQPSNAAANDASPAKLAKARDRIEAQLNLEILLRHQELRLIEQELAKAQVSLEQLRRCHVIPFPGTPGSTATFDQISDGTGPTLEPPTGHTRPSRPAPWGVADGPYSQHYARWLIPDDVFDSATQSQARARHSTGGKSYPSSDARGLRGSDRDVTVANRRQRQSVSLKANTTLNTSLLPKDKPAGPLKLKRSDGVWVKLVCRHCQKEDVNSVQGFLNHCRIAHSDTMRTHQEAAAAHGVVLEDDEVVVTPPPVKQTPVSATFGSSWASQPPQVHSLNAAHRRSNTQSSFSTPTRPSPLHSIDGAFDAESRMATPMTASYHPSPVRASSYVSTHHSQATSRPHAIPVSTVQQQAVTGSQTPGFVGSSHTPLLSALAQKRGYGLDLAKLVTSAQQKVDLDQVESLIADSEDQGETPPPAATVRQSLHTQSNVSMARMPRQPSPLIQSTTASGAVVPRHLSAVIPNSASSSFGPIENSAAQAHLHQRSAMSTPSPQSAAPTLALSHVHELSPRTAESNPGMVTDHEDDPDDDDDENYEEVPDSECDDSTGIHSSSQHSVRIRGEDDVEMRDVESTDGDHAETKLAPPQEPTKQPLRKRRGRPPK